MVYQYTLLSGGLVDTINFLSHFQGSDMEAENDDYQDVETSLGRPFDNAFVIHADDMFPPSRLTSK